MNGGTCITSGGELEKRGRDGGGTNITRQGEEDATAAAFVKRCQIFNPGVLSVLLCNR